jgi:hypothetical protein
LTVIYRLPWYQQVNRRDTGHVSLPSSTSRRPRRDMPQLEPKYNLKATIPSNSC